MSPFFSISHDIHCLGSHKPLMLIAIFSPWYIQRIQFLLVALSPFALCQFIGWGLNFWKKKLFMIYFESEYTHHSSYAKPIEFPQNYVSFSSFWFSSSEHLMFKESVPFSNTPFSRQNRCFFSFIISISISNINASHIVGALFWVLFIISFNHYNCILRSVGPETETGRGDFPPFFSFVWLKKILIDFICYSSFRYT